MSEINSKPSLILLDGMALVYRSYYALLPTRMQTKKGFPTGATYGFINTVTKLLDTYKPDYIGVTFDSKEKTFRHDIYPQYKANRPIPPEDLIMQLEKIFALVEASGFTMLKMPGFEADDIMGSLARKFENEANDFLVTPDKDFSQLVHDGVKILKPSREDDKFDLYGREEIRTRYGVYPEQFIDMLTLMGDTSDNVPGADGVGPKTAANLINEYGSIDDLFKNISKLTKYKIKESLLDAKEHLKIGKFLVTIKTDIPLDYTLNDFKAKEPDTDVLLPLLEELEFRSLLAKFKRQTVAAAIEPNSQFDLELNSDVDFFSFVQPHTLGKYHLITEPDAFEELCKKLEDAQEFAFDTETTSIHAVKAELVAISFAIHSKEAYSVFCGGLELTRDAIVKRLKPILENPRILKVGQNIKYDMLVLKKYDIELQPVAFDTMLASYVLNADKPHNMDDMAAEYFKYKTITYSELVGTGKAEKSIYDVPLDLLARYSCQDADVTLQLKNILAEKLRAEPQLERLCNEIEFPLVKVLASMENEGISIDKKTLSEISETLVIEISKAAKEIYEAAGGEFNIDSPKQLAEVLFERLQLPPKKRTKTGYSTDVRVLEELAAEFPVANKILEYRSLQKLKGTYVDALPELVNPATKKIHTTFNQSVAATGRLSSTNPNLQNIPIRTEAGRQIRRAFIPRGNNFKLLSADYSQIELRVAAELSGDETMLNAFVNHEDIHTATARVVFGIHDVTKDMRRKAKEVNFGVLYGIQPFGLAQRLDIPQSEAKAIIENYKAKYPKIFTYLTSIIEHARKNGFVETLSKRRRFFPDINNKNFSIRNAAERAAINTPIQGTSADMIKVAMILLWNELQERKFQSKLILQVHDELLFDAEESEIESLKSLAVTMMKEAAKKVGVKTVPIEVETGVGENWLVAH